MPEITPRDSNPQPPQRRSVLGFLSISETEETGIIGGYLLINLLGQPVEFHCTTPVHANRAQEILYGPTLRPYLYGEQVAATLLGKSKARPRLVCVQSYATAPARGLAGMPMVLIHESEEESVRSTNQIDSTGGSDPPFRVSPPPGAAPGATWQSANLPDLTASVLSDYAEDAQLAGQVLPEHRRYVDLREPFERIQLAIAEAAKGYAAQNDRLAAG